MQELMVAMVLLGWIQLISVASGRNGILYSAGWAFATTAVMFAGAWDAQVPVHIDIAQYFAAIWPVMMLVFWSGWVAGGLLRPILRALKWAGAIR